MKVNVISWNMAGAKVFSKLDGPPRAAADTYTQDFQNAWKDYVIPHIRSHSPTAQDPDIILLQECIGFVDYRTASSGRWDTGQSILKQIFNGYDCFFFPAFSSLTQPNPARWDKFRKGGGTPNYIPDKIEAQQGYGVCVKEGLLRRLWVSEAKPPEDKPDIDLPNGSDTLCFEAIRTTTGLYLGNRDTEPRLTVLGRIKLVDEAANERYLNFLNVHLTTLKGEREGNLRIDYIAGTERLQQLELIRDNIISAYQVATHRVSRTSPTRKEDIWIIAGDFNATQNSREINFLTQAGFVDGIPDKRLYDETGQFHNQIGTKWSGSEPSGPPIVVDHIFCGLQPTAFPAGGVNTGNSLRPYRPAFPSGSPYKPDHALLFASFDIP